MQLAKRARAGTTKSTPPTTPGLVLNRRDTNPTADQVDDRLRNYVAETKTAAPFLIKYATGADDGAHLEYLGTTRRIRDQDEQPGYGELHLVAYLELLLDTDYRLTEGWWFAGDLASGQGRSVLSTHPNATSGDEFLDLVVELLMLIRGLPNLARTREDAKSETDWHKKFRAKNVNAQYLGSQH